MYNPVYELEHFGVPGMKWGVRKSSPSRVRVLTNKANRLAWKSEKIQRKATKKLVSRIESDRKQGKATTIEKPDQWVKAIKYRDKARKVIDELYPEMAKIPWSDLEKQSLYKDVKYWKTPRWA